MQASIIQVDRVSPCISIRRAKRHLNDIGCELESLKEISSQFVLAPAMPCPADFSRATDVIAFACLTHPSSPLTTSNQ
jgi:hypothetical protein